MRNIVLVAFLFSGFAASAQLVNPGFEVCSSFPTNTGQWQVVDGWNNAGSMLASPDYYHYLGAPAADLPETPMAMVDAYEGDAIMGLIASGVQFTNVREYVTAVFGTPMETGKEYIVSFKLTNGFKTEVSTAGLAVSDLGLYFSTSQPIQNGQLPLIVAPQFSLDTVFFSREWESINFIFEADQDYRYMTFGLFGDDSDKDIEIMEGDHPTYAYYFIDDFFMEAVPENYDPTHADHPKGEYNDVPNDNVPPPMDASHAEDFFVPNSFTPNGDGNNDIFIPVSGAVKEYEFSIYSRWGELLFTTADETKGWDGTYHGKRGESATYVWEVEYVKLESDNQPKRYELRGTVNLVR